MIPLTDSFARRIDYLRVSVTDRCNLRCVYCLPEHHANPPASPELLTDAEVTRLVACFMALGFTKVRLTGGEPLTRPGVARLVYDLSQLPNLQDLAMSTNGVLLAPLARELARAGLKRVNISLDSLKADRFQRATRLGRLGQALAGVDAALAAGLTPVKLNVVVVRGLNEDEIADFVRLTEEAPVHVRFIELMPMGETGFFTKDRWVSFDEMWERAQPLVPLLPLDLPRGHGPARYFKRPGAPGTVGFINALSCGFCSACNRVRLSARGVLVPCLDGEDGVDLRTPLRQGASDARLKENIRQVVRAKPEKHFMLERAQQTGSYNFTPAAQPRFMSQIGG